ncbi:MAG: cadmium resistance transporter [Clostridia bacterium]|nr:cadmium resistance transporter [Clostridia bacterium]
MLADTLSAAVAYTATNIDDLFLLMLLYAQTDTKVGRGRILVGRYLSMLLLTAVSLGGALGARMLPDLVIRLLGLIPIALGVKAIFEGDGDGANSAEPTALGTAALSIASGADNIGVYIPLFAGYTIGGMIAAVVVFALLTLALCMLGQRLMSLGWLHGLLEKHKRWLVPAVLIMLGVGILLGI